MNLKHIQELLVLKERLKSSESIENWELRQIITAIIDAILDGLA